MPLCTYWGQRTALWGQFSPSTFCGLPGLHPCPQARVAVFSLLCSPTLPHLILSIDFLYVKSFYVLFSCICKLIYIRAGAHVRKRTWSFPWFVFHLEFWDRVSQFCLKRADPAKLTRMEPQEPFCYFSPCMETGVHATTSICFPPGFLQGCWGADSGFCVCWPVTSLNGLCPQILFYCCVVSVCVGGVCVITWQ